MRRSELVASNIVVAIAAFTGQAAHAERWIQVTPTDALVWYDADNVRPTANHRIGVWVSTGPHRTNPGANGVTSYPTYSIIDCRQRTASSKLSLDLGKASMPYASNSGMGELIEKLCS